MERTDNRLTGFTLIELLVSISIIVILMAILVPAVDRALEYSKISQCSANLKSIGTAFKLYQNDHAGTGHPRRNWGRWLANGTGEELIEPSHVKAYWGVAYVKWGAERKAYSCPTATESDAAAPAPPPDDNYDGTFESGNTFTTYSFNGCTEDPGAGTATTLFSPMFLTRGAEAPATPAASIKSPAETIVAQDGYETMLDGNGDTPRSLAQWPNPPASTQYFRHLSGGAILWADTHVSHFVPPNASPDDWPERWYARTRNALGFPQ